MKHNKSIISSLNDDLNFETNNPEALKHLLVFASAEERGKVFKQDFKIFSILGHFFVAS